MLDVLAIGFIPCLEKRNEKRHRTRCTVCVPAPANANRHCSVLCRIFEPLRRFVGWREFGLGGGGALWAMPRCTNIRRHDSRPIHDCEPSRILHLNLNALVYPMMYFSVPKNRSTICSNDEPTQTRIRQFSYSPITKFNHSSIQNVLLAWSEIAVFR